MVVAEGWAMNIAKRRGKQKAIVALARRLAVIMHRMWCDGTEFRLDEGNCTGCCLINRGLDTASPEQESDPSSASWRRVSEVARQI